MITLRVHLLGPFRLESADGDEILLDGRITREMLSFLLLHRDHLLSRETLASVFWGDLPTSKALKHLRQALWNLQSNLRLISRSPGTNLIRIDSSKVILASSSELWLDVAILDRAIRRAQGIPGHALDQAAADDLRAAAALYRGDLLEGWYQDWCLLERERLQASYVTILDKLMAYAEVHHAFEEGLEYGARILRFDRARESTYRCLMRLYVLAGDRTAALRQYQRCATALQEELGVRPTRATERLLEFVRADQPLADVSRPGVAHDESTPSLQYLFAELHHLRSSLDDVQAQVKRELEHVEVLLNRFPSR